MDDTLSVGNSSLAALFLQIHAGYESKVVKLLRKKGHTRIYKTLGKHDLVAFFDVNTVDDRRLYFSSPGVSSSNPLLAFNLITKGYQSPDIFPWSEQSNILGFIFLEIDKILYSEELGPESCANVCSMVIPILRKFSEESDIKIAIYGGYGKAELYVIVDASDINDLWRITKFLRNLDYSLLFPEESALYPSLPIFCKTNTIPCLSYESIPLNQNDEFGKPEFNGDTSAAITASCQPGFEQYIAEEFKSENGYLCLGGLGTNDVSIQVPKIKLSDLIFQLLNFREKWDQKHKSAIATKTTLLDLNPSKGKLNAETYLVREKNVDLNVPKKLRKNHPRLANRVLHLSRNLNANINNTIHQFTVSGVYKYTLYLQEHLDQYNETNLDEARKYHLESKIAECIENAEIGLFQRIESGFGSASNHYDIPMPFGDGVFSSLVAIEYLINNIFETWQKARKKPEDYPFALGAHGFPMFRDSHGFQMRWGEIFTLPLVALYDPSDSRGSWLTLSHEISHAIYIRLNVGTIEESALSKVYSQSFSGRETTAGFKDDYVFNDEIFELFAHWYDYYHFYDCDLDIYLKHVWSSWKHIPVVHRVPIDYFFRTFFVYCVHNYDDSIAPAKRESNKEYVRVMKQMWVDHLKVIASISDGSLDSLIDQVEKKRADFFQHFTRHLPTIKIFKRYKDNKFRTAINASYKELKEQISSINSGQIASGQIKNPYLLTKNIINTKLDHKDQKASTALILSIKNLETFYTLDSQKGVPEDE